MAVIDSSGIGQLEGPYRHEAKRLQTGHVYPHRVERGVPFLSILVKATAVGLLLWAAPQAIPQLNPLRPPDFTVSSPLPKALPPISAAAKMPVGYLDRLEKRLSLNPCDYSNSRLAGTPVNAVALVEAKGNGCAVWDIPQALKIKSFLGSIDLDGRRVPVVGYAHMPRPEDESPVLIIDIVGGPAGDISPGLNDTLQVALARRGAIVIKPAYSGTRHRSHYPSPDLGRAVQEVRDLAGKLRRANPKSKIVLMGESLGGYIAETAAATQRDLPVDDAVLVLPLVYSPSQATINFNRTASKSGKELISMWIRAPRQSEYAYQSVLSSRLFTSFFPEKNRNISLIDYLSERKAFPTMIAYGEADGRVGVEKLETAKSLPNNIHLLKLERNGHAIDAKAAEHIVGAMWSTFSLR